MSKLFSPHQIGPLELPNRIAIAPMCQYSARRWLRHRLAHDPPRPPGPVRRRPPDHRGDRRHRGRPHLARRPGPVVRRTRAALEPVINAIRRHAPIKIAIQLGHAGRKASSEVPWQGGANIPPDHRAAGRPSRPQHAACGRRNRAAGARRAGLQRVKDGFVAAARAPMRWDWTRSRSTAPTATCCTSSCRRCRTGATTNTAARWKTACASRSRCSRRSAPRCRRRWWWACASRPPTGSRAAGTRSRAWRFARELEQAGLPVHPRVERRPVAAAEDPGRPGYQIEFAARIKQRSRRCR
jgi:hypothetical protein